MTPGIYTISPRIRLYQITSGEVTDNITNLIDLINSPNVIKTNNTETL
jgi:hypothetical protein